MAENKIGLTKIIITALVTAIATSIVQYQLINYKLKKDQSYWKKRYGVEYMSKIIDKKMDYMDEMNNEILQLEVLAKDIKLKTVEMNGSQSVKSKIDKAAEIRLMGVEYQKKVNLHSGRIQMISFYFGDNIDSLIPLHRTALEENFKNNLFLSTEFDSLNIDNQLDADFNTIEQLTNIRLQLVQEMYKEILEDAEKIFSL